MSNENGSAPRVVVPACANEEAAPAQKGRHDENWPPVRTTIAKGSGYKHSAYGRSPSALAVRAQKVARLVRRMRAAMPWLEDADLPTCRAWAELEIIGASLFAGIVKEGATYTDGKGDVAARRLVDDHRKNRIAKLAYERELGMTPLARQQLRVNSGREALDLAAAVAMPDDCRPQKLPA